MSDKSSGHRKPPKHPQKRAGALPPRPRVPGQTATGGIGPISLDTLAELFRRSPQPFGAGLLDGGMLAFNQAFCDLIGYSEEEIPLLDWSKDLTPPEWRDHEAAMLDQLVRTGQPVRYEKEYVRKDGSRVPVELLVQLMVDEEGAPAYYFASIQDLTERKRAEEALRESAERYRLLAETMLQGVVHQDVTGRIIAMNPAAERILGKSPKQFLGSSSVGEEHHTTREDGSPFPGMEHPAMVALRTGQHVRGVIMGVFNPQRNEHRWISIDAVPLLRPGETRPLEVYTVFEDITERKRAEAEIESLARFPAENPNPVLRLSRDGAILYANEAGWSILPEGDNATGDAAPEFLRELIDEAFGKQANATIDVERGGKWWSFLVAPLPDAGYANLYGRDITERKRAEEALANSQMKLRTFLELLPVGVSVLDGNRKILFSNPALSRIVRLDPGDLSARAHEKRVYLRADGSELPPEEIPSVQAARKGDPVEDVEVGVRLESGETVWLSVSANPLPFEDWQVAVVSQDVTARRRADEALRFQAHLLESVQDAVVATDPQDRVIYWNRSAEELFGWTADEALGRPRSEVTTTSQSDGEDIWAHIQTGKVWSGEHHHRRRDGSLFPASCTVSPILGKDGGVIGAVTVTSDTTERKRAEEALRESEEKFSRLYSSMVEGVALHEVVSDGSGKAIDYVMTDVNPAFELITGLSRLDTIGGKASEVYGTGEAPYLDIYSRVATSGKPESFETYFPPMQKHFSISAFSLGQNRFATAFQDVTERKRAEEALRESQRDLARAQAVSHLGSWRLDVRRDVLTWSDESYRMFGIPPGTPLTYEIFLDRVHPEDREAIDRAWQAGLSGAPYDIEHRITVDGATRWIRERAELEFDDSGALLGGFGTCQDITDRKRADEALRESEERLRLAQSSARVGVWDWHIDEGTVALTPELNEIYGLPPGTIKTYEDWRDFAHPDDIEGVEAERDEAIANHEPFDLEFRIVHTSGEIRWISAKGSAAYDDSGRPVRVLGVNVDVTDRKRAEEALRDSEEKFKLIATHTPDHILVQDKDLRYTWALNPQLGLTLDDMIGKTDFEFLPKEDAANLTTIKRRVLETGNPEYVATPIVSLEGRTEYFEGSYVPTHDSGGQVNGLIGYFRNVTERVKTEEEMRLQSTALQAAANGIVITDRDGNIQWVNNAFTRLTGYAAAEAIGQNPRILKSGRQDQPFYKDLWDTILSGRVWHGEIVNKRKDGRLYTEEMTITPVVDDHGAVTNFIAIKQDISARKAAEEALAEANARTETLLGANFIGVAEFDATKIVSANRAFLDMTGYSEGDVARGRIDWREITPPEHAERDNRAWREMLEHGECLPYEKEYVARNGKRVPILTAGVRLTEDPVTGVFLTLDITDWKLMERELVETTHYAEHLFESRLMGLTRFNEQGLVEANDAFLDMIGYTHEDLRDGLIDVKSITPAEYRAIDERAVGEMLTKGEAAQHEKEYIRKDGSRVPVLVGRKLIKQSPLEWVAFVLDLTERKRIEADLERVRTEFLGEVSHELKTPLTAIKGCASMALSSHTPPDPMETRELFEVVDTQANRLTDLVGNLLDMTRIEAGRLSIEPNEVDLAKIVDEARVVFEHSRYPHLLQIDLPPTLSRVRADGRRIVQVLSNLYSNAAKYSSPQTPIVVSAERSGSEVIVHVRDSGAGIPADKMPLLFQKFVQINTIGAKGTGLGLFICKGIIEAQGGRIWAESPGDGQGATFSFALPAVPGKARAATKVEGRGQGPETSRWRPHRSHRRRTTHPALRRILPQERRL